MTCNFQTGRFGCIPAFKLWDTLLFSRRLMPSRFQLKVYWNIRLKVCNFPACLTRHTFLCCSFTLRLCPRHDQPIECIFFASRQLSLSLLRIISVTPLKVDGHPMCITELSVWWSASEWYATLSGGLLQRVLRPPVKFMPPDGNLAMPPLPVTLDLTLQQCSVMS